jgi:uncharacterized membrane protein YkvA (DUF1232 family)
VGILLLGKRCEVQKVFSWPFRRNRAVTIPQEATIGMSWKSQAQRVHREAQVYYFAFKHPRVPWYAKLVAACSAGYLFSPIQLIPSYIPVIGFSDDFLVLFVGAKLLRRLIPPEVLAECRQLANAAEMRRKEEIRSAAAIVAFVAIAAVWLLAAVGASLLMARYISAGKATVK